MNRNLTPDDAPLITLDIDWAPDFVIDFVADILIQAGVKATWFVTHESEAVERLRAFPSLFELGIHPNFLPGTSHGQTLDEVVQHCVQLVPEASCMRTHGLFQSSQMLAYVYVSTPISTDVSLFLPRCPGLRPVSYVSGGALHHRIPYFWEDDVEMMQYQPQWSLDSLLSAGPGLKILDFHPVHVYLNSATMDPYIALKDSVAALQYASRAELDRAISRGIGTRTLFEDVVSYLSQRDTLRIMDLETNPAANCDKTAHVL